jgi:porin
LWLARPVAAEESKAGWSTGLDLTLEGAASLRGGARPGSALHGLALSHLEWQQAENADRTTNFHAFVSTLTLAGRGPTEKFLGDFLAASNMEGYASTRLYTWWVEAQKGDWSLRAGALLADEEFAGTEAGGNLFNSAFGWPAFISANTLNTGPAFYVAALGARVERKLGETAAWRLGVYDGDTFDSIDGDGAVTRHGLHYGLGGAQGFFAISEAEFAPSDSANSFKVGAWAHSAKFADVRDDASGQRLAATGGDPRQHHGNFGAYGVIERTLAGKKDEAGYVTAYVRGGFAPQDRNALGYAVDAGVAALGLIPGRGNDTTALGFVHASFSPRFAANAQAADPASRAPDFEQVVELNHTVALAEHFSVQPDLQFIRHPGGSAAQRDALAFLLRVKASY